MMNRIGATLLRPNVRLSGRSIEHCQVRWGKLPPKVRRGLPQPEVLAPKHGCHFLPGLFGLGVFALGAGVGGKAGRANSDRGGFAPFAPTRMLLALSLPAASSRNVTVSAFGPTLNVTPSVL